VVWKIFSIYWECHHPNWLIYFFRWVETTNQIYNNLYIYICHNYTSRWYVRNYIRIICPGDHPNGDIAMDKLFFFELVASFRFGGLELLECPSHMVYIRLFFLCLEHLYIYIYLSKVIAQQLFFFQDLSWRSKRHSKEICRTLDIIWGCGLRWKTFYPLVNVYIAMENHHF